ncbi:MAG: hypothetical protein BGO98_45950 [Myxococcales bacterium 68-20]|nr:MAG: hypothetical protein BGO98_45950 [Myxococcales bacterium 68-20]
MSSTLTSVGGYRYEDEMRTRLVTALVSGSLLLSLPHCGSTYADLCEKQRDCEGGNDKDVQACIEFARGGEEVAAAYDCSDAYERQASCLTNRAVCKDKRLDDSACKAEEAALTACEKAASGKKQ